MDEMSFPTSYKRALLNKTKTKTIRIRDQIGKYRTGRTYRAQSYAGKVWDIKIKIASVRLTTLNKLPEFGIPARTISSIRRKHGVSLSEKVDLILFRVLYPLWVSVQYFGW